jgi:hypothetical protein
MPQSLPDCLPNLLISSPVQIGASGRSEKEGGGGGRGSCRGPLTSEAATSAQPLTLPPCAQPSDIHRVLRHLHHSRACPLRPSSTRCTTGHARARYHPIRSASGSRGFVVDAIDFATAGEERGGGAGEAIRPLRLPPALHLHHPRPHASPLALDAKIPAIAEVGQGGGRGKSGGGGGGEATWPMRLPPTPRHPRANQPPHRRVTCRTASPPTHHVAPEPLVRAPAATSVRPGQGGDRSTHGSL